MTGQTPEATKIYRDKFSSRINEWLREYSRRPETKAIRRAYRERNPDMQMWTNAKSRSKRDGLDFNIERSDIHIPERCPILDIPLMISIGKVSPNSPTLDRVDNTKGYVKGNVCVISHRANSMKQNNTLETLEKLTQYIKENALVDQR